MKALLRRRGQIELAEVAAPAVVRADDVRLRVLVAGVCRTDVYAARGLLPVREPVILGHEFVAEVVETGAAVAGLEAGARVAVCPVLVCGSCEGCLHAADHERLGRCIQRRFLGQDVDGAFAEGVVVPANVVRRVPRDLPDRVAAFAEPVAAALAVLDSGLVVGARGLLVGSGRIATLTERVLRLAGFDRLDVIAPELAETARANTYDYAVEAAASSITIGACLRALRPGGLLVMKSRTPLAVELDPRLVVQKQLTLRGAEYASFDQALERLAGGGLSLADLLGPEAPLADFERVFEAALDESSGKQFFRIAFASQPGPSGPGEG